MKNPFEVTGDLAEIRIWHLPKKSHERPEDKSRALELTYSVIDATAYMYTVCPGSVRTVFIINTRRELFSKFHCFYSK
jgi:hypothetical protein